MSPKCPRCKGRKRLVQWLCDSCFKKWEKLNKPQNKQIGSLMKEFEKNYEQEREKVQFD